MRENHVLNGRECITRLHHMSNPTAARKLLVKEASRAIVGHCQCDVRGIPDRRVRQVRLRPGYSSVCRTPHMERIDIAFAPAVRPADINRGTVIRIYRYGKCRTDTLLPQGRRI